MSEFSFFGQLLNETWSLAEALDWRCCWEPVISPQSAFEELRRLCAAGLVAGWGRKYNWDWHKFRPEQPPAWEPFIGTPCDENIPRDDWENLALVVDDAGHPTGELRFTYARVLAWSGTWFNKMNLRIAWLRLMAMAGPPAEAIEAEQLLEEKRLGMTGEEALTPQAAPPFSPAALQNGDPDELYLKRVEELKAELQRYPTQKDDEIWCRVKNLRQREGGMRLSTRDTARALRRAHLPKSKGRRRIS